MGDDERDWARAANRLGRETTPGEPTRWVERLWQQAEDDEVDTPWDRTALHPALADAVGSLGPGDGRRAVVVGAALGADAEALARAGWRTTAFDVAASAVRLARSRHPDSPVDYREGDLLDLDPALVGAFDLVVEVFTVQAMPPDVRTRAVAGIRALLAPGGVALVVQHVRGDSDPDDGPPWMLDREQMESFAADGFTLALEELPASRDEWSTPLWRGTLRRA